jgi:hypothetical protein
MLYLHLFLNYPATHLNSCNSNDRSRLHAFVYGSLLLLEVFGFLKASLGETHKLYCNEQAYRQFDTNDITLKNTDVKETLFNHNCYNFPTHAQFFTTLLLIPAYMFRPFWAIIRAS